VTVLDTAHSKFELAAAPGWTVARFKAEGERRHGVPPISQRLIYLGKMLDDGDTLEECGVLSGGGGGTGGPIVHLFPKPNVVVTRGGREPDGSSSGGDGDGDGDGDGNRGGGAHVPQIYLDADEVSSPVLVLSSREIFDATHRVKVLSFVLFFISLMELLTLFGIAMGGAEDEASAVAAGYGGGGGGSGWSDGDEGGGREIPPGDPTDSVPPYAPGGEAAEVRSWRATDWGDLAVSALGLYVSTVGMRAANESTVRLAKRYLVGLFASGIGWLAYQYCLNVLVLEDLEEAEETEAEDADDAMSGVPGYGGGSLEEDYGDPRSAALGTLLLPTLVWGVCWLRAWEFHSLVAAAEREAEERARFLAGGDDGNGVSDGDGDGDRNNDFSDDGDEEVGGSVRRTEYAHDLELRVQVEDRTLT